MNTVETDYLVMGAGAAGMSFTDALIDADPECDVVMVDRRHAPGGHWNDAYPFVRLHQPAACYGVNSRPLGMDKLDERGLNAGLYQQADGVEICDYFRRVMDEHHVASGRVRFFPMSTCFGLEASDVAFVASLTGATMDVAVRRAVVDARYS
jgi:cation diffusion facilitator CzcD-associated flavoprotein CzcO